MFVTGKRTRLRNGSASKGGQSHVVARGVVSGAGCRLFFVRATWSATSEKFSVSCVLRLVRVSLASRDQPKKDGARSSTVLLRAPSFRLIARCYFTSVTSTSKVITVFGPMLVPVAPVAP